MDSYINSYFMRTNCGRISGSRSKGCKCVFHKIKAIIDLEHCLGLPLSTI